MVFAQQDPAPEPAPTIDPQPVLAIGTVANPREALARTEPEAAAAILRGLTWLRTQQRDDGRWDSDAAPDGPGSAVHDVGVTSLVLLALAREGTAARTDPRHGALLRGCHWLVQQQDGGLVGVRASHTFIYGHAIATFGLCATAAATGAAEARTAAEAGLAYLETHRNPFMVWRYLPRDGDNDTSVTTWATMACLAGRELGLTVPGKAFESVRQYLIAVTDADGRTGYTRAGEPSSRLQREANPFPPERGEAMTAAALWCRQALGEHAADPQLARGVALVLGKPPQWNPEQGDVDLCYWFFAAEALRRLGDDGARRPWQQQLVKALLQGQRQQGATAGSWDPVDPWGSEGGRLYTTALAVLALQTLYDVPALRPAADTK
jgi:hypothetical protein